MQKESLLSSVLVGGHPLCSVECISCLVRPHPSYDTYKNLPRYHDTSAAAVSNFHEEIRRFSYPLHELEKVVITLAGIFPPTCK